MFEFLGLVKTAVRFIEFFHISNFNYVIIFVPNVNISYAINETVVTNSSMYYTTLGYFSWFIGNKMINKCGRCPSDPCGFINYLG